MKNISVQIQYWYDTFLKLDENNARILTYLTSSPGHYSHLQTSSVSVDFKSYCLFFFSIKDLEDQAE